MFHVVANDIIHCFSFLFFLFIRFLEIQFYLCFSDSPEIPYLGYLGVLTNFQQFASTHSAGKAEYMSPSINAMIRRRAEMYLGVFAAVKGPRQLYSNELLLSLYTVLLLRPEGSIAKLALDCILAYKQPSLVPYEETLSKLMDEKSLREELIVFDASEGGSIDRSHRAVAVPVIQYMLFGRLLSKVTGNKSKDQKLSRLEYTGYSQLAFV